MNTVSAKDPFFRNIKIALGLFLACGFGFLLWLVLEFSQIELCSNEVVSEHPSPNGRLKAIVFTRDCGATTTNSRQVSVIASSESLPNQSGNVFVSRYEPALDITWVDDRNLTISGGGADQSSPKIKGYPGIHVTYH